MGARQVRIGLLGAVAVAGVSLTAVTLSTGPTGAALVATVVLIVAQGLLLLGVERAPVAVAAGVIVLGAGLQLLIGDLGPGLAVAAVFGLAAHRSPRVSLVGLAALLATAPLALVDAPAQSAVMSAATAVAAWSLGELVRSRRLRRAAALRAVAEQERAALAREVHDIVGHALSAIVVQAGAAEDVFDARPDRARAALGAIDATARAALAEVRATVAGPGSPHDLADLRALVDRLPDSGPRVQLRLDGEVDAVPAAAAGSAYRIVQEALTNVLRHAGATRVDIAVSAAPGELAIAVDDDGAGARRAPRADGSGIAGMRARAQLHGGTFRAGPRADGGFGVRATLPLGAGR
jgi:signal transduction histidine kinase